MGPGLWFKNKSITVTQELEQSTVLDGEDDRVILEQIWDGKVFLRPLTARAQFELSKRQLDANFELWGIPESVELAQGDIINDGTRDYRIQEREPTFDGPLGHAGWHVLLRAVI